MIWIMLLAPVILLATYGLYGRFFGRNWGDIRQNIYLNRMTGMLWVFGIYYILWGIIGIAYNIESKSCENKLSALQQDGYYNFPEGCMIELKDGRSVPLDQWRFIAGTD